jgi:hypothetical protein
MTNRFTIKEFYGGCPDKCSCPKDLPVCPNCGVHYFGIHVEYCLRLSSLLGVPIPLVKEPSQK